MGPRGELGLTINEFYGQTECNLVLSSCAAIGVSRAGAIGTAVPGHRVAVIDEEGERVQPGETGQIAIAPAGPGDVPRILAERRKRPRKSSSATG